MPQTEDRPVRPERLILDAIPMDVPDVAELLVELDELRARRDEEK